MQRLSLLLVMVSIFIVGHSAPATREDSDREKVLPSLLHGIEEAEMEQKNIEESVGSFLNLLNNYAQNKPSPEPQVLHTLTGGLEAREMDDFPNVFRQMLTLMKEYAKSLFNKKQTLSPDEQIFKRFSSIFLDMMIEASKSIGQEAGVKRGNKFLELLSGQGGSDASTEKRKQVSFGSPYPSFSHRRPLLPYFYRGGR